MAGLGVVALTLLAAMFLPLVAHSGTYAPPTPLEDLHILDFLELAGSQSKAGIALAMHQSTVCRSLQLMQHLRLAYREHRLMEGLLRIGTEFAPPEPAQQPGWGAAGAAPVSQR
jgi:hypothetical protein